VHERQPGECVLRGVFVSFCSSAHHLWHVLVDREQDVVTAVARDLRSEAKAKIISAPSAADIDRRQQNEATRMFLFKPEQYFQLFNGRNAVASSNDGGEPDGPIWTAATSKSLQVLLMVRSFVIVGVVKHVMLPFTMQPLPVADVEIESEHSSTSHGDHGR